MGVMALTWYLHVFGIVRSLVFTGLTRNWPSDSASEALIFYPSFSPILTWGGGGGGGHPNAPHSVCMVVYVHIER